MNEKPNKARDYFGTSNVHTPWWDRQVNTTRGELTINIAAYAAAAAFLVWLLWR
jgi:hypothetical protein